MSVPRPRTQIQPRIRPHQSFLIQRLPLEGRAEEGKRDVLPGMTAGAFLSAVPSPIEGSGTAWVMLGSWALSPARPTPIPPRHECRGFSALLVKKEILTP